MNLLSPVARVVAWIGAALILKRTWSNDSFPQAQGPNPTIPAAVPQSIPTLKMPTAHGWRDGRMPVAAPGLKVNAFATGLTHPRQMLVLPNGHVLAAEALSLPGAPRTAFDLAITATMARAGATGVSPNRIILLRDADGDGVAEIRSTLLENLNQPFGMAMVGETLYVANVDGVMAFPFKLGETRITARGRRLSTYKVDGHWTRNLLLSPDQTKLYVAVGSLSNIGDAGMEAEEGRAWIYELDLRTEQSRLFAGGLRNPVGMAWEPTLGQVWTVVNERDGIGDETPPDYLTSVKATRRRPTT